MGDRLPETFDVLVVGTGLVESIVSAAVSRIGHSVLHIDPRDYYGKYYFAFDGSILGPILILSMLTS